ncbi:chemotaxis protein CheX [Cytobacillus depressus]|uniref:Chemotaxis protein CheX n=1 Tax=Cytobacillus depressus TaxID=1602942 RepID=A0A6L3VAP7_9BACI|nr:chemotaxis protein CheX [Cytobacillus depressus]KAB2338262.1 chemotaxis protein CheX [Cytobacillus depressus]
MSLTKSVTDILNGTIEAVKAVVPLEIHVEKPALFTQPFNQHSFGVLIGMTGDARGRIIIDGDGWVFGKIGEAMFGIELEGEMLESFAGELGNMIAGSISTYVSEKGFEMDITPPTVLVGQTKVYGFSKAYRLPVTVQNIGNLMIVLMVE